MPALIGFNVGVELGQLTVIALAFLAVELVDPVGQSARFPTTGMIPIHVIAATYAEEHWSV